MSSKAHVDHVGTVPPLYRGLFTETISADVFGMWHLGAPS